MQFINFLKQIKAFFFKRDRAIDMAFLDKVEPAIDEIIHNIESLNYTQKTFEVIGSGSCLAKINALTLELKNLVEDLIALEKQYKYSSNYAVLTEIEDAKKYCQGSFVHLYDIFNLIQSNTINNISNESLLSIIARLERDVRKIDASLRRIACILMEGSDHKFKSNASISQFSIGLIKSESKLTLIHTCIMAYEGLTSMPFFSRQDTAYEQLGRFKKAVDNMICCLEHSPIQQLAFDSILLELLSTLESIRFCINRTAESGKRLDDKVKLISHTIRRMSHDITRENSLESLRK
jgi:hypothetical protein